MAGLAFEGFGSLNRNIMVNEWNYEILCDLERSVITDWKISNQIERGGIPFPNVYVINSEMEIIYHSQDKLRSRADPKPLLNFLRDHQKDPTIRMKNDQRTIMRPLVKEWLLGLPKKFRLL